MPVGGAGGVLRAVPLVDDDPIDVPPVIGELEVVHDRYLVLVVRFLSNRKVVNLDRSDLRTI